MCSRAVLDVDVERGDYAPSQQPFDGEHPVLVVLCAWGSRSMALDLLGLGSLSRAGRCDVGADASLS